MNIIDTIKMVFSGLDPDNNEIWNSSIQFLYDYISELPHIEYERAINYLGLTSLAQYKYIDVNDIDKVVHEKFKGISNRGVA